MSKENIDIAKTVMDRIDSGRVAMRPAWYFVAGSIGLVIGLAALAVMLVFVFMLVAFSLRTHGPMGEYRLEQLWSGFPWWAVPVTIAGLAIGIILLRRYDFSYRRNFIPIVIGLVLALALAGFTADQLDLATYLPGTGLMQQLYQRYDGGYRRRQSPSDRPLPTGHPSSTGNPASTGYPRRLHQSR